MSASIVIRFKNARFIFKNLVLLVLSNIQEIQNVGQKKSYGRTNWTTH